MSDEVVSTEKAKKKKEVKVQGGSGDSVYTLGLIGAWVFYIGRASTPQEKVKGFFKGFIWPAVFVYEMLKYFNKE